MTTIRNFWCLECKAWVPCIRAGVGYMCAAKGHTILCDVCGKPWTDKHECEGKP